MSETTNRRASFANRERRALASALRAVGPLAPTLCEGWDAGDLAAHVWQRDNRVWEGVGLAVKPLAGVTEKSMQRIKDRPWPEVVSEVENGPVSKASMFQVSRINDMANVAEMFIHTEDVRRANGETTPRPMSAEDADQLWKQALMMARMLMRKAPVGVSLERTGDRPVVVKKGEPMVCMVAPAGELLLWLSGRREHAHVEFTGSPEAIEQLKGFATHL